jgi:NAD-dependent dihydropyrimidine dehydrogenase PreA subunit
MSDAVYHRLAGVLDSLPNGYPATESGVEIKILKKIFEPEQADLCCDLQLRFESAEEIAERTGRPLEGLDERLLAMFKRGQITTLKIGGVRKYKLVPFAVGIYEMQMPHLDRELAELHEEYLPVYLKGYLGDSPHWFQSIPIEKELTWDQEALSFQKISGLLEASQSFGVADCHCKKEQGLLGKPCDKPVHICMALAPVPNAFDRNPTFEAISREEIEVLLRKAEESGLVHLTSNWKKGNYLICNCCSCCCGVLGSINELGIPAWTVINSDYYAQIDEDLCSLCGICAEERCQVYAIDEEDDAYRVSPEKCIGCGLCITTCPEEAIRLVRKPAEDIKPRMANEKEWFKERAKQRGIDISKLQ